MMVFEYAPNGTLFEHLHGIHYFYVLHILDANIYYYQLEEKWNLKGYNIYFVFFS